VAVKKPSTPTISDELLAKFDNEIQQLEQIRHPNIVMLLAVHRKPPALFMVVELVDGGSFHQLLHEPSGFNCTSGAVSPPPLQTATSIVEVAGKAIAFLHARGIVHCNVTSQNVRLSPRLEVKLCEFGSARKTSELAAGVTAAPTGTPSYMAPELFQNQAYSETVDVFAYGTLLWEAVAQEMPFANLDSAAIRKQVLAGQMPAMPSRAPFPLQAVMKACWTMDRSVRPGMELVLEQFQAALLRGTVRRPNTAP
jgi:serine/threonine protein kinase